MYVLAWLMIVAAFVGLLIYEARNERDRWFWLAYSLTVGSALYATLDHPRLVEWGVCGALIFYGVDRILDIWREKR